MDVDPVVDIKRVKSPILILQGASDVQVLPTGSAAPDGGSKIGESRRDVARVPERQSPVHERHSGEPLNPNAALNQYLTVPAWIDQNVLQTMIAWLDARSAKT